MQFDGTTKLHRKSGFGLHQLRNRYNGCCTRPRKANKPKIVRCSACPTLANSVSYSLCASFDTQTCDSHEVARMQCGQDAVRTKAILQP